MLLFAFHPASAALAGLAAAFLGLSAFAADLTPALALATTAAGAALAAVLRWLQLAVQAARWDAGYPVR